VSDVKKDLEAEIKDEVEKRFKAEFDEELGKSATCIRIKLIASRVKI